ncbi:MAG TPA: nuclear transport factor 2 family protein [Longimicrobiales bacterium]|nr:nuclear transport factor 2 family protein [Longimicrobiales bacterium]
MRRVALALAVLAVTACASAAPSAEREEHTADEAAVVATVNALFDAMRTRDTAAIRRLSHPELRLYVPGMQEGRPVTRTSTLQEFIASVVRGNVVFDERAYDPEVRIDGNLAAVWTYYEFRLGERFSHCGIDAFHLARAADGWRITALSYTTRDTGCRER